MAVASVARSDEISPDPLGNTDELLSQLAGSEIDRLLAEADADALPQASGGASGTMGPMAGDHAMADESAPPPAPATLTAELDALFTELEQTTTAEKTAPIGTVYPASPQAHKGQHAAPASAPSQKPDAPPEGAERAAMLKAAGFDVDVASEDPIAATAPTAEPENIAAEQSAPRIDDEAERSSILEAAGFEGPASSEEGESPDAAVDPELESLPMLLRPLQWLSAPVDSCPPGVRQFLGHAGILTMIMSLAVLMYIWISRHN